MSLDEFLGMHFIFMALIENMKYDSNIMLLKIGNCITTNMNRFQLNLNNDLKLLKNQIISENDYNSSYNFLNNNHISFDRETILNNIVKLAQLTSLFSKLIRKIINNFKLEKLDEIKIIVNFICEPSVTSLL